MAIGEIHFPKVKFFPGRENKKKGKWGIVSKITRLYDRANTRFATALSKYYLKSISDYAEARLEKFAAEYPEADINKLKQQLVEEHIRVIPIAASMVLTQIKAANMRFALGALVAGVTTAATGGAGLAIIGPIFGTGVVVNFGVALYQSRTSFRERYKAGIDGKIAIYKQALDVAREARQPSTSPVPGIDQSIAPPRLAHPAASPQPIVPPSIISDQQVTAVNWVNGIVQTVQYARNIPQAWNERVTALVAEGRARQYVQADIRVTSPTQYEIIWLHPDATPAQFQSYQQAADKEQWLAQHPQLWVKYSYTNGQFSGESHGAAVSNTILPPQRSGNSYAIRVIESQGNVKDITINGAARHLTVVGGNKAPAFRPAANHQAQLLARNRSRANLPIVGAA